MADQAYEPTPTEGLRAVLDELDEQTRRPDEEPLRVAVARQARERLAEMEPHPLGHDHPWGHGYCMPSCPTLGEEAGRG